MPKRRSIDGVPTNIFDDLSERHIEYVWRELHERFGFDIKKWKKQFEEHFNKQPHSASRIGIFCRYGNEKIQPILNGILCRPEYFGTFNKLLEYVIRKY